MYALLGRTEFDLVLVALHTAARSVTPTLPRKLGTIDGRDERDQPD